MRLSRPVYEALPYVYVAGGFGALLASFLWRTAAWTELLALPGVLLIVIGLVLVLKRRDYRIQMRRYGGEFDDD
ncbi:MAG: hypothetical protein FJ191_11370 [Gammaproteobacteria bacterium]|nr:hypothetical protein [Gammaproteobacteria bacterium]